MQGDVVFEAAVVRTEWLDRRTKGETNDRKV